MAEMDSYGPASGFSSGSIRSFSAIPYHKLCEFPNHPVLSPVPQEAPEPFRW